MTVSELDPRTTALVLVDLQRGVVGPPVASTARPAHEHGYNVALAEDATSALSADDHRFAFTRIFPRLGRVASTDQVLGGLR